MGQSPSSTGCPSTGIRASSQSLTSAPADNGATATSVVASAWSVDRPALSGGLLHNIACGGCLRNLPTDDVCDVRVRRGGKDRRNGAPEFWGIEKEEEFTLRLPPHYALGSLSSLEQGNAGLVLQRSSSSSSSSSSSLSTSLTWWRSTRDFHIVRERLCVRNSRRRFDEFYRTTKDEMAD